MFGDGPFWAILGQVLSEFVKMKYFYFLIEMALYCVMYLYSIKILLI